MVMVAHLLLYLSILMNLRLLLLHSDTFSCLSPPPDGVEGADTKFNAAFKISTTIACVLLLVIILTISISVCVFLKVRRKVNTNLKRNIHKEENVQDTSGEIGASFDGRVTNKDHDIQIELKPNTAYEVCALAQFHDEGVYYSYPNV